MKFGFEGPLTSEFLPGGKIRLLGDLIYRSPSNREWRIPAGFVCDLASVPKLIPGFIRVFFGDKLATAKPAVLHDYLYSKGALTRRDSDSLFYEALRLENQSLMGAWIMWIGVRIGGWRAWEHD